jgi:alkylation response protein AidB-like acyl-CoA dehydrogenase
MTTTAHQGIEDFTMAVSNEEQMMIDLVAEFIDEQVKPSVNQVEHANEYPEAWIQTMKDMGIYGLAIDEPWGAWSRSRPRHMRSSLRSSPAGGCPLAGAMGGHTVVAKLLQEYGTACSRRTSTCRGWPPASCGRRWR